MSITVKAVSELERVALAALLAHGTNPKNAGPVARAIALAEAEGNSVCGLFYLPIFCEHLRCGKVDGTATAIVDVDGPIVRVDAAFGFAHPAIAAGLVPLVAAAQSFGIAALSVRNSYNCLALGHHVRPIADSGLIGICMSNAPASVSPPGARERLFGTNPLAFAVPSIAGEPILVDQSMSAVTKTAMILRRQRGEAIPEGWAQDRAGNAVTDAAAGLEGSLLPAGGQKGANIALLIELLAAALTGSQLSVQASSFGDNEGGPPSVGQFFIAIDPGHFAGQEFARLTSELASAFDMARVRMPGSERKLATSVQLESNLWREACKLAALRI